NVAEHWQKHQREILRFAARFLRLKMRNPIRRGVTRSYNDAEGPLPHCHYTVYAGRARRIVMLASALRVSVPCWFIG
ncbi:MAG: hypothetical protein N2Z22_09745, partial [Turneriella sp.]|nr:hypothetical protein [Turneriella sp.]